MQIYPVTLMGRQRSRFEVRDEEYVFYLFMRYADDDTECYFLSFNVCGSDRMCIRCYVRCMRKQSLKF